MTDQQIMPFDAPDSAADESAVNRACQRIMASWPLDYWVATSPWWHWQDQTIQTAAARLETLANVRCLMPADWYQSAWGKGLISADHLRRAAQTDADVDPDCSVENLVARLSKSNKAQKQAFITLPSMLDRQTNRQTPILWRLEVTDQISHFMAQWTGSHSSADGTIPVDAASHLYSDWLASLQRERGLIWRTGQRWLRSSVKDLPDTSHQMLRNGLETLGIGPAEITEAVSTALLMELHGWASRLASTAWQEQLSGGGQNVTLVRELLAVRLAWETLLYQGLPALAGSQADNIRAQWHQQCLELPHLISQTEYRNRHIWVWQRAAELAYTDRLESRLLGSQVSTPERPTIQAVLCIDVRSEPMRRALEEQSSDIQTVGFAGFFGLPLSVQEDASGESRPSVPGLLAPSLVLNTVSGRNTMGTDWHTSVSHGALTALGYVETAGLKYVRALWSGRRNPAAANTTPDSAPVTHRDGRPVLYEDMAATCAQALRGMGLADSLARTVLLIGHGGESMNNPMASSLHCGACGGHTGENHVRILCRWLNKPAIRTRLANHGIDIPEETVFLPALHNTTREAVSLLENGHPRAPDISAILEQGTQQAQLWRTDNDRAPAVAKGLSPGLTLAARATDWSEVRPEWALAGNAAIIIAPRAWTRKMDLEGRVFLHDYNWRDDADYQLLHQLMTAPMLVTHWINMQYYSSVTEPAFFGSGDKTLHNVVAGNQGVFEGNGGDLRTGLPLQSVHNGSDWVHEPLRITAYIAAPPSVILRIIRANDTLRQLVDNEWIWVKAWCPSGANFMNIRV